MANFVDTLTGAAREKRQGSHRVEFDGAFRKYYYFWTVIAIEHRAERKFAVDRSYGTSSTKKACYQYVSHFGRNGYDELETIQDVLDLEKNIVIDKEDDTYYFYNGFGKPKVIYLDDPDFEMTHGYQGDVTEDVLEEHTAQINESDVDYNDVMSTYSIYRNPSLAELQEANRNFGLDENAYLDDFLND
jgi:hypothetical protein